MFALVKGIYFCPTKSHTQAFQKCTPRITAPQDGVYDGKAARDMWFR